ncbi:MAG: TiaS agmantine-binding domain-containing protein [Methanobacteriaceae archaeon]
MYFKGDFIKVLHIGIDDTDSPNGMCTTYLASEIINELKLNNFEVIDFPRLIRLNPFAKFKTRGNGAVHIKVAININNMEKIKNIVINAVNNLSELDNDNTNPGIVFFEDTLDSDVSNKMHSYAIKAINSIITISEAKSFAEEIGAEIYPIKKGRGIIGALAAIGIQLDDKTYELLSYRIPENYGINRSIDFDSVVKMDNLTGKGTFENIDNGYLAIEPHTPCPILYGIRGESGKILMEAKRIVKVNEPVDSYCIFETNQHTDIHIQNMGKIADMEQNSCYCVMGTVKDNPRVIKGGHIFFTLSDSSGEIECGAYEPTKDFRKITKELVPGDILNVYGGIGKNNTLNIEKFNILQLADKFDYENPICECGKRMTSAGRNKGFKCAKCGNRLRDANKIAKKVPRVLEEKFYETPISARRHLAKPLVRFKEDELSNKCNFSNSS